LEKSQKKTAVNSFENFKPSVSPAMEYLMANCIQWQIKDRFVKIPMSDLNPFKPEISRLIIPRFISKEKQ